MSSQKQAAVKEKEYHAKAVEQRRASTVFQNTINEENKERERKRESEAAEVEKPRFSFEPDRLEGNKNSKRIYYQRPEDMKTELKIPY